MIEESKCQPIWENALKLSNGIEGFRKYLRNFDKKKPNP
jgi:hypothetical protein